MKTSIKMLIVAVAVMLTVLVPASFFFQKYVRGPMQESERRQRELLSPAVYTGLATAMRTLWEAKGGKEIREPIDVDPADAAVAPEIARMRPLSILVFQSGVDLNVGGGFEHFGLQSIYQDPAMDNRRWMRNREFPSVKLTDELWFYSESGIPK